MSSRTQIKHGAIISYVAIIVNVVAALIYTPWMIKEIGTANYGLYALATSFISLFVVDFGISSSLTRFLAKYKAKNDTDSIAKILGAAYQIYFLIDVVLLFVLLLVYFNIDIIYDELSALELSTFKLLFVIVGFFSFISFPAMTLDGILSSHEHFVAIKVCGVVRKFLSIGLVILALAMSWGVEALVLSNVIAGIVAIAIKIYIVTKKNHIRVIFLLHSNPFRGKLLGFSIWITMILFANKLMYNMTPTVLAIVSGSIAIALYAPASTLGGYFYIFAEAINGLFLPYISRKIANNQERDIDDLLVKVGRFQIIFLGLIFTGFVCVGQDFVKLWLGDDFAQTYICTILIFLPALFEYSQQIGNLMIVAKNEVKIQGVFFVIIGILSLILSFALALIWGAIGACVAICIGGLARVIVQNWIFHYRLGMVLNLFYKECFIKSLIPTVLTILTFAVIPHFNLYNRMVTLVLNTIVVVSIYACYTKFIVLKDLSVGFMLSKIRN